MREWWSKLARLLGRSRLDDELRAEIDSHLQMEVEARIEAGATPHEALASARRDFGNRTRIQESAREAWLFLWIETAARDVRYGLRLLRRSPGFALTAITVISIGIGATTAAFSLFDRVLLRPLPFPQPQQLVRIFTTDLPNGVPRVETSPPNFLDWRGMNKSFSAMGVYQQFAYNLSGHGDPIRLDGAVLTSDVFKALGVQTLAGRRFEAPDDRDGAPNVIVVGEPLAVSLFGSARDAIGRTLKLDDQLQTIVGVMPGTFAFPSRAVALWKPLRFSPQLLALRRNQAFNVIARLRPDVTVDQARTEMNVIATQLERAYPKDNAGLGIAVVEMRDVLSPQSRVLVLVVFGAAMSLLVIACTNLANLLLARAITRRHEMAVRVAIGAGRGRLLRQLWTESCVLSAVGGVLGSLVAAVAMPLLTRFVPNALPVGSALELDVRVLTFAILLTLCTTVVFGVAPAVRSMRRADPLALRVRSASAGHADRVRSTLVIVEVVATVAMLVATGLLLKALWRVQSVDPGFSPDGVLTLRTWLPTPKYNDPVLRRRFYAKVLDETRAVPGVRSAAYTTAVPLVFGAGIFPATVQGVADDPNTAPRVSIRLITPDFFQTLGIPLRRGRAFRDADDAMAPFVTVISESIAARLWPGQEPIGRIVRIAGNDRTVIGVVGDIAVRGLERSSEPQAYFPSEQIGAGMTFYAPRDVVVRAGGDPLALAPALRSIIHAADPELPVSDVQPLSAIVSSQTAERRDQLLVLSLLAAIALLLAAIGIHGLLAFTVSTRTREIGVRVALGAARSTIVTMFLRQGLILGGVGIMVAVPLSYGLARGMSALLFGVEPGDPAIYASAVILIVVMTLIGTLRPAWSAAAIDPAAATRAE